MLKFSLAPLQGYTDSEYRSAFHTFFGSIDTYYSPFIRKDKGGEVRNKDIRDIGEAKDQKVHFIPQILVKDATETTELIQVASNAGYSEIDINMGCPFPPVVKSGRGSGLLLSPDQIEQILDTACKLEGLAISVKLRLGFEKPDEILELLPRLEQFPLQHLTIHARTTKQQYKGEVNIEAFKQAYDQTSLPLIYNGDIKTIEDISRIEQNFPKLKGLMIGRGLLENPFLIQEYTSKSCYSYAYKFEQIIAFHDLLMSEYTKRLCGDHQLLTKLKSIWDYLMPELDKKTRKRIKKSNSLNKYREALSLHP